MAAAVALLALTGAAAPPEGTLDVRVTNVRNGKGRVHIDLCPQALFLKDGCPFSASVPSVAGTTVLTLRGVPAGQYAVQAFHDENANNKVDRGLFGIPKEGVGFSNDAPIRMSPPKWAAAAFAFDGQEQTIQLKIHYFL